MKVTKLNVKVMCDMSMCGRFASYSIGTGCKGGWHKGTDTYICSECMQQLYEEFGKILVPKSPDNMIKKAIKRRSERETSEI